MNQTEREIRTTEAALALLDSEDAWTQGMSIGSIATAGRTCFCLAGAVGVAAGGVTVAYSAERRANAASAAVLSLISQHPLVIERTEGLDAVDYDDVVTNFNDHDDTTLEDVRQVLTDVRSTLWERASYSDD